jgi:hypothetical protein
MSKPDLSTYGGRLRDLGYAGEIVDTNPVTIESKTNDQATAIDFGVAVARSAADNTCKAPSAVSDKIIGISVRHAIRPADSSNNVNYAQKDSVPILRDGYVYAVAAENVSRGDTVVALTASSGTLGSAANTAVGTAAAPVAVGTGNGVMTLDATTPVLAGAKNGSYVVTCVTAATNGGTFLVEDPDGYVLGDVAVGATFADDIKFVIADGSTDFIVGDKFTIAVTTGAGRIPLDGNNGNAKAQWETTTTSGSIGVVSVLN